jgi:hypothetical protein
VDQFEVIAATPYQARDKVECECKQKGWLYIRTIQIEKKGLAFAFWEDNYEFLTEEELKEATTVNWPELAAKMILSSKVYDRKKEATVKAYQMESLEAAIKAYIGLGGGHTIDHPKASAIDYHPGPKIEFWLHTSEQDKYESVIVEKRKFLAACKRVWKELNGQQTLFPV